MNNSEKGNRFEEEAASFFISENYEVLERNYRRKTGEIDLIVTDHKALVFVEVKYRKSISKGFPEEAVNDLKKKRIMRTAEWYLKEKKLPFNIPCRFDVISILDGEIHHIKNAFGGF